MITATPVKFEIHEATETLAVITMFDEGGSGVEIKTIVDPASWRELSTVIAAAPEQMHPTKDTE